MSASTRRHERRADAVLLDPERLAMWSSFRALAEHGVSALHQWTPDDGLPFASALPAHQHTVPTLTVCLSGSVRIAGRITIDLSPGEALLIEPGCWHRHPPYRPGSTAFALGFLAGRCDLIFFRACGAAVGRGARAAISWPDHGSA